MKRNFLIDLFWRVHPRLYEWSGGRVGASIMGMPVLLLTTRGRRSGRPRTKALMYLPHGEDFVVFASVLGEARHPFWWLNLEAEPRAKVQVGRERYVVVAREAEGAERAALWQAVVQRVAAYDGYQAKTSRRIPVVVLEQRGPVSD